ncbi:MAG TPA: FkbM family methyltransferase [Acidimicrobiales bacterium]|jgi:FkbM family methyltransferase|nr:FkbM family methyltransferase [Acidimicrobiales bacterium]
MISYAQNREDVVLDRLFPRGADGFYIDIGAYDPTYNSVTRHFYDLGWHGINVEPSSAPFERLSAMRPRDVNVNAGVADREGELAFYESPPDSGWSTFDEQQAKTHIEAGIPLVRRTAPVTTLARLCEDHVRTTIDFLSVDVEGYEGQVLRGADWSRWRPRVVVVEATRPGTTVPTHEAWEHVLLDADYLFAAFDGLNRYYVRSEDAVLVDPLRVPANVLDEFVPYEFARQIEAANGSAQAALHELAATKALNQAYQAESAAFRQQVTFLHAEYKRLETRYRELELALLASKTQYEVVRAMIADVRSRYEQMRHDMAAAMEQVAATQKMVEGVAADGLAVARRLSRLSQRFPQAGSLVKASMRKAVDVKRRLPSGR